MQGGRIIKNAESAFLQLLTVDFLEGSCEHEATWSSLELTESSPWLFMHRIR